MANGDATAPDSSTNALNVTVSVGSNVPAELGKQIDAAVHRAVLSELAQVDVGPGFRLEALPPEGVTAAAAPADETHYGIFFVIHF